MGVDRAPIADERERDHDEIGGSGLASTIRPVIRADASGGIGLAIARCSALASTIVTAASGSSRRRTSAVRGNRPPPTMSTRDRAGSGQEPRERALVRGEDERWSAGDRSTSARAPRG